MVYPGWYRMVYTGWYTGLPTTRVGYTGLPTTRVWYTQHSLSGWCIPSIASQDGVYPACLLRVWYTQHVSHGCGIPSLTSRVVHTQPNLTGGPYPASLSSGVERQHRSPPVLKGRLRTLGGV